MFIGKNEENRYDLVGFNNLLSRSKEELLKLSVSKLVKITNKISAYACVDTERELVMSVHETKKEAESRYHIVKVKVVKLSGTYDI